MQKQKARAANSVQANVQKHFFRTRTVKCAKKDIINKTKQTKDKKEAPTTYTQCYN